MKLRIEFPVLSGYRLEIPDAELHLDLSKTSTIRIDEGTVPSWVESQGIVGQTERVEGITEMRPQQVAFHIAAKVLKQYFSSQDDPRPWLFPRIVEFTRRWINECVQLGHGYTLGYLSLTTPQREAAEAIYNAITRQEGEGARRPRLRPLLRPGQPTGSTDDVDFHTHREVFETTFSPINLVTLDGPQGNTWEKKLAQACEHLGQAGVITSYVKNEHLGLVIPYVHQGIAHEYWPDFVLRLSSETRAAAADPDIERYLLVEVSGSQKDAAQTAAKARTARDSWCVAVNNDGRFGRWGYIELRQAEMTHPESVLCETIDNLVHDRPIIGDPDLLGGWQDTEGITRTMSTERQV